jgi:5S rRNA maturation endonuclease (ribonuclease M5)
MKGSSTKFTAVQCRRYFEARMPRLSKAHGRKDLACACPFHEDRSASFSVDPDRGVWKCHAGCGQGGVIDFEMKFSSCEKNAAWTNVSEIMGLPQTTVRAEQPEHKYVYTDAHGNTVFEYLRFPNKRFQVRRPNGQGGWIYEIKTTKKPLYRLHELIRSNTVFIVEGEKDADNVTAAVRAWVESKGLTHKISAVATTNANGVEGWSSEYAPYFLGKDVVVLRDNDDPGLKLALRILRDVQPYAATVKFVELPGLAEHEDVTDWVEKHGHAPEELMQLALGAPIWKPDVKDDGMFVDAVTFMNSMPEEVEWMVDGIIQRGANGMCVADPKSMKSFAMLDLAVCCALGLPWLGNRIQRRVKTAIVSREDWPGLTSVRMRQLFLGKKSEHADIENWLYVNSRAQKPSFLLDEDADLQMLIDDLKRLECEFVVLDVFRRLHRGEENDNTEMQALLDRITRVQHETGCALAMVHHINKNREGGSVFDRTRGASAMFGWAEWMAGITTVNPEEPPRKQIRKMEFACKAACALDPLYFMGENVGPNVRLVTLPEPPQARAKAKKGIPVKPAGPEEDVGF